MVRFRVHDLSRAAAMAAVVGLAACTAPDPSVTRGEIFDPYEESNRKTHEFNRALDKALVRPAGNAYGGVIPQGMQENVGNFAENLSAPGMITNNVLQGDARGGAINLFRFLINSTFGFGGIIDAATEFGVNVEYTDFGETLHVWGAREGAYIELPILGPSTERDALGKAVDLFTNPLTYVLSGSDRRYSRAAGVAKRLGERNRYGDTVDSVLHESADSYAQARLIYLQSRRFDLGGDMDALYADPYAKSADAGAENAYEDPYADPYAE